jgi:CheY-like chemotaxis protein
VAVATVVVCDDNKTVRAAISTACAEAGLDVVAETDSGADAVEMVRRFGVDVVILDHGLADGTGESTVTTLRAEAPKTALIVFSEHVTDPTRLRRQGVRDVVEKPAFDALAAALIHVQTVPDRSGHPDDRRHGSHEVVDPPKLWRSPAGVCAHQDLTHSLQTLEAGDAALAVTVVGLERLEADVGPLLAADCRLAVAGALREELRVQDLLHEAPQIDGFLALLRGGDARASGAVWARLTEAVRADELPGQLKGASARVSELGPKDATSRAVGALLEASLTTPTYSSL